MVMAYNREFKFSTPQVKQIHLETLDEPSIPSLTMSLNNPKYFISSQETILFLLLVAHALART